MEDVSGSFRQKFLVNMRYQTFNLVIRFAGVLMGKGVMGLLVQAKTCKSVSSRTLLVVIAAISCSLVAI